MLESRTRLGGFSSPQYQIDHRTRKASLSPVCAQKPAVLEDSRQPLSRFGRATSLLLVLKARQRSTVAHGKPFPDNQAMFPWHPCQVFKITECSNFIMSS